jgi:hypothetical protein
MNNGSNMHCTYADSAIAQTLPAVFNSFHTNFAIRKKNSFNVYLDKYGSCYAYGSTKAFERQQRPVGLKYWRR